MIHLLWANVAHLQKITSVTNEYLWNIVQDAHNSWYHFIFFFKWNCKEKHKYNLFPQNNHIQEFRIMFRKWSQIQYDKCLFHFAYSKTQMKIEVLVQVAWDNVSYADNDNDDDNSNGDVFNTATSSDLIRYACQKEF